MSKIEKISIALTVDMLACVNEAVDSGRYATVSEVVRDALRDWQDHQVRRKYFLADITRLIEQGEASGVQPWEGVEAIKSEGRRLLLEKKQAA
jgi:antitoxin ParD1/3/4